MIDAQQVPVHGHNVPAAPAGAAQHSRDVQAPAPSPAGIPDVPAHATGASAPQAPARQPQSQDEFLHSQPQRPALDPRLEELLKQDAARKDPMEGVKVEKPDIVKPAPEQERPTGGLNDIDLSNIEDPHLRSLGELFIASAPNVDIERALGKAIEYMDPNLIDHHYIKEVGGEKAKALVGIAQQIVNTARTHGEATVRAIHEGAGGRENWEAAVAMFNKQAPLHMRQVAADLLDSKNAGKIKSGAQFILEYAKQNGGLTQQPQYQNPSAGRGDVAQALTKAQFQAALQKLVPEHQNPQYFEQRAELHARRKLGRDLGL